MALQDLQAIVTTVKTNAVVTHVDSKVVTSHVFARAVLTLDDQIDYIDIVGELAFNQYLFNTETLG